MQGDWVNRHSLAPWGAPEAINDSPASAVLDLAPAHVPPELRTRLAGIDGKWFYLKSEFVSGDTLHAVTVSRVVAKEGRKTVPPADALKRLKYADADIAALLARGAGDCADVAAGPALTAVIQALTGAGGGGSPAAAGGGARAAGDGESRKGR